MAKKKVVKKIARSKTQKKVVTVKKPAKTVSAPSVRRITAKLPRKK